MTKKITKNSTPLIRAAGGLVWRIQDGQPEIVLIHRLRYNDWAFPKGKLRAGERWDAAALREVAEETGHRARLEQFAGVLSYAVDQRPKVVLFWNMSVAGPDENACQESDTPDEVSQVAWLTIPQAIERLSYADERDLLVEEARRLYDNQDG